jgi:hypothetical protein
MWYCPLGGSFHVLRVKRREAYMVLPPGRAHAETSGFASPLCCFDNRNIPAMHRRGEFRRYGVGAWFLG